MIKFKRTTEYALIALHHMHHKEITTAGTVTSARKVADRFNLPFEITAKTLQRLRDTGIIQSAQGSRGGYHLSKDLEQVSLKNFLTLLEGDQATVPCSHSDTDCNLVQLCPIQGFMFGVSSKILTVLEQISLKELVLSQPIHTPFTQTQIEKGIFQNEAAV